MPPSKPPALSPWLPAHLPLLQSAQPAQGRAAGRARAHLVLAAPAGVVQVVVAPVVMGPVLRLLIQPVELVGAALHVVLQGVQILLPLLGTSLGRGRGGELSPKLLSTGHLGVPGHPGKGPLPRALPRRDLGGLLPAASGIWLGSRSCIPGETGEARQELGACLQRAVFWRGWIEGGGCGVYGICLVVKLRVGVRRSTSGLGVGLGNHSTWSRLQQLGWWAAIAFVKWLGMGPTPWGSRERGAGELTLLPSLAMWGPMAMTSLWKMLCSSTWLLTSGRSVPKPLLLNTSYGAQELRLAVGERDAAAKTWETPLGGGHGAGLGWALVLAACG